MLVSSVTCGNCGADCPEKGRFCPHCGTALYLICSHCGQKNTQSLAHCSHCNAALQSKNPERWKKPVVDSGRPLERRQLTIMFTDLVDSTGLADSMDPEDFLALIEAHRTIAVAPIMRLGGVVARYLGDGMLVLFGYPEAHEDNPERAVRAGLEVARATTEMNQRWVGEGKGRIGVRVGIHTGIVVVGDVLKADVQELMAVFGNTPSIASRLQALAQPNSVVLSSATKALLPEAIRCESRGNVTLKGLKRPIEIFSALEVREGEGDRRPAGRVLPFVNRDQELATIRQHWAAARRGEGGYLTIEGEPGIGKSRLIRAVQERIVTQPSRWLITRTSPYAANTDFFAFSELCRRLLAPDVADADPKAAYDAFKTTLKSQGLDDANLTIGLARLIGIDIPEDATATPLQPERARELTLAAITAWLQHEAQKQPLVLVIEDLHWADASSLEAIDRLKPTLPNHPLLLICATRTSSTGVREDVPGSTDGAPESLDEVKMAPSLEAAQARPANGTGTGVTVVMLERLRAEPAADLLGHVLRGTELPTESVTTLLERANGVPLYLEELPKPVLEAGGQTQNTPIALPATLRDSLMAQLDRMGEAKAVAQTAAVLGHSFERPLLERVWESDPQSLDAGLKVLASAALIQPETEMLPPSYGFRHALLAEIAYESLLRDERRRIHKRTAGILAAHFRPLVEIRPDLLARHHEAAGNYQEACDCWLMAGKVAARRSANVEALGHLEKAEALITLQSRSTPSKDLDQQRLDLKMAQGPVMVALSGWAAPEVEEIFRTVIDISKSMKLGQRRQIDAIGGLFNVFLLRGDLTQARIVARQLEMMTADGANEDLKARLHRWLGICDFFHGDFCSAVSRMEASIALSDFEDQTRHTEVTGTNPNIIAQSISAWGHWFLGDDIKSDRVIRSTIDIARSAGHPFSLCYALSIASSVYQCQNQHSKSLICAEEVLRLSNENAFPYWSAWAKIVTGWGYGVEGNTREGLRLIATGLEDYRKTGAAQMRGYALCLMAETHKHAGQWKDVVTKAKQAIHELDQGSVTFYGSEAYRLLGEARARLQLSQRPPKRSFVRSFRIAKKCKAPSLFLKTFRSMSEVQPAEWDHGPLLANLSSILSEIERSAPSVDLLPLRKRFRPGDSEAH